MRTPTILSVSALAAALLAGGVFIAPAFAKDNRSGRDVERDWLPIPQLHKQIEAAGYRDVEEIEREHGQYEARATDREGKRVKLYLNPRTGNIEDRDRHDGRRDRDGMGTVSEGARGSAECSQRRCRDDLPVNTSAVPTAPK